MRNNFSIAVLVIFLSFSKVFGQKYTDCNMLNPLYVRAEQSAKFNGSLREYFEHEFEGKFENFTGSINLTILIDSNGKACCTTISNNNSRVNSTEIKNVVNKMNGWVAAKQNNHSVNFAATILLIFNQSKLSVNYTNGEPVILKPVTNTNTTNNPEIVKDKKNNTLWKLWNFNNSLIPTNLSINIAMDSLGTIWCCTYGGIVRITDDDHWQIFNGANVPVLADKNNATWTTGLAVDRSNNVWVKSFDYVVRYDGKQWTKFDTSNSPLKLVHKICVDKNGEIWFCTFQGLIRHDGKNWTKFTSSNSKLASDNVKEVFLDKNETLWIATDKGINKVINGKWSLLNKDNSNIPDNDITSIKADLTGNVWAGIGTRDKNYLIKIDTANNISVFPSGVIWNITVDDNANKIWLATNGKGLVSFDGENFVQYDKTNSLIQNNTVSDMVIDKNGDKWVSTFGGLVFTNKK